MLSSNTPSSYVPKRHALSLVVRSVPVASVVTPRQVFRSEERTSLTSGVDSRMTSSDVAAQSRSGTRVANVVGCVLHSPPDQGTGFAKQDMGNMWGCIKDASTPGGWDVC
jgi:hypothetical protein